MAKAVVVPDLLDTLPFHSVLTWERFQTLCTDLLYQLFKSVDSREYLTKGSKQQGIDVYSVRKGEEKLTVAQCKLVDHMTPQKVIDAIEEFLKGSLAAETKEFILCTSADLSRQQDEEKTMSIARKKLGVHGIELIIWDSRGLSKELRTNATHEIINIVYRYFGEPIALSFYDNLWIEYVKKLRTVKKHLYEIPQDYIERHISSYSEQLQNQHTGYWHAWDKKSKSTLIQLIGENTGKQKIVLLSTAGFGKTEELKNLAGHFSDEEKILYPIKYSLRDYEGQPIENLLLSYDQDWRNIERENMLLIFDGLDEVRENFSQSFINHLNAFVEQNPAIHAVVSSRYNFYNVKHPQLRDFEIYLLDNLSYYDIQNYIDNKLKTKRHEFEDLLRERGFYEYISNPYYLTRLVRFYNDKEPFPKNKTDLFNRILFERLEKDEDRYNLPELKEKLLPIAQKIAFCMTVSGKSSLTDEDMKMIVPDQETKKLLNHFGILNRNATNLGSWSFEHKNLQEYLCASVFAAHSFSDIQKVVAFKLNSNKLLSRYLNTISFVFELLDKKSTTFHELFTWLNTNEPELLVRFEKEQLSKQTRIEIFEHILHYYKNQGITLRVSINFSYEELARFVEVDDKLIDFIEKQINSGLPHALIYDVLTVLEHCKRHYLYKDKLHMLLASILNTIGYPEFIYAKAITAYPSFGFTEEQIFRQFLTCGIDLTSYDIRNSCLFFLTDTNYYENYSEFILDSIDILEEEHRLKKRSSSYATLKQLILKFESPTKVKELLQYCISDKHAIQRHSHYREFHLELSEVKTILDKAAEAWKIDKTILPKIYRIYCQIEHISVDAEWFNPFKSFFERTCGIRTIFQKFYRYDKRQRDIMIFANEWCCDFLIEEYKKGNITDKEMTIFRNVLSHTNCELSLYFYEQLKPLGEGVFIIEDLMVDYNSIRLQQEDKNQEMLLDQKLFFEEAETIFDTISKDNIALDDLWYSENKDLRKYQESIVLETIRNLCIHNNDKIITPEAFFNKYSQANEWKGFVIDSTFALIKDQKSVKLQLLQGLKEWCNNKIETLNFENSIVDDGRSYRYIPIIEFVKDIFQLTDMELEDRLLLKMLPSDHETFYNYNQENKETFASLIISKVKDKELLRKSVIDNIKSGKIAILVLSSHYSICHQLGYNECLPYLYQTITSHPLLSDYNRITLTNFYLDLGGEVVDFKSQLTIPIIETEEASYTSWQWYLLEKLLFIEEERTTEILLTILDSEHPVSNKLKAAEQLLNLSRIEGLEYVAFHIRENRVLPFEHRWANLQPYIAELPTENAIEIFISLLEFSYQNNLQDNFSGRYFIDESIYNSLITLSKKGHQYYTLIKDLITDLVNRFSTEHFVDSIKFYSERLTQRYYESHTQEVDIETASLIFEETFK